MSRFASRLATCFGTQAWRLSSAAVADNRISFGCVNIPASFYDRYIDPLFSRTSGVVYVLPETQPAVRLFRFLRGPSS